MAPAQQRVEQHALPPKPPAPTDTQLIKPDAAIDDAVRLAMKRKAEREQAFLTEVKKKFIAEALKLHDKIPKLTTIMTKSESFSPALFGTTTQPVSFDKESVTAGLRLLSDFEEKVNGAYEKQLEVLEYMRGYTFFGDIIKETDKVVKMYSGLRVLTFEPRGLLGDLLLAADEDSDGQAKPQHIGSNGQQNGGQIVKATPLDDW